MAGPAAAAASPHGTFRIARSGHPAHRPGHPAAQPRRAARRTALPHRIPSPGLAAVHRVRRQLRAADRADAARRPAPGGRCGRRLRRTRGEHAPCVTRRGRGGRGGRRPGGGRGSALRRPATARGAGGGRGGDLDGPRGARAVADLGGGDRRRRGLGLLRRVRLPWSRARRGHHPVRRHRGRRRSGGPRRPRGAGEARRADDTGPPAPPRTDAHPRHRHRARLDALCEALGTAGPDGGPRHRRSAAAWRRRRCRRDRRARIVENALADAAAGGCASTTAGGRARRWRCPTRRCATRHWPAAPRADADGAEHLWAALARETPDPEAAEPAALLAACALLRGDGALAGIALDRAEQAWPGHRLTGLLRAAWEAGMPPERVRECLSATGRQPCRSRRRGRRRTTARRAAGDAGPARSTRSRKGRSGGQAAGRRSCGKRQASATIVGEVGAAPGRQPSAAVAAALEATSTAGSPPRRGRDHRRDRVPGHRAAGLDHLAHREAGAAAEVVDRVLAGLARAPARAGGPRRGRRRGCSRGCRCRPASASRRRRSASTPGRPDATCSTIGMRWVSTTCRSPNRPCAPGHVEVAQAHRGQAVRHARTR